jgi:hypothetical protein
METELLYVGEVTHFFNKISVAVVRLEQDLYLDDWVLFYGPHTEFEQQVTSMQIDRNPVDKGVAGEEIAIKVIERVRDGDEIYLLPEEEG